MSITAVVFPDPVATIITYLSEHVRADYAQDPRPDDQQGLYVQVTDGGGTGQWERAFEDVRLIVVCSAEDSMVASEAARTCDALLRAWHTETGLWLATISRPVYLPDPDMRVPAYQLTHTLRFRGDEVTIP